LGLPTFLLERNFDEAIFQNRLIQGFHKGIVGFKSSTEGTLVREKEQNIFLFYQKKTIISHGLYDI